MKRGNKTILPLASALAALAGNGLIGGDANSAVASDAGKAADLEANQKTVGQPNTIISTGETLLGFIMTEQPDGTVIAQHVSHASHASHASHYSSR
jgi:hypothetical protein